MLRHLLLQLFGPDVGRAGCVCLSSHHRRKNLDGKTGPAAFFFLPPFRFLLCLFVLFGLRLPLAADEDSPAAAAAAVHVRGNSRNFF